MDRKKFTLRDLIVIGSFFVIALAAIIYQSQNHWKAFPEHSIDFQVDKTESQEIAFEFCQKLNLDLGEFQHSALFNYDEESKTFLEKELGFDEARELIIDDFPLFFWSNRWFKPLEIEEVYVQITPDGRIKSFNHKIPEDEKLSSLQLNEAKNLSAKFLADQLDIELKDWEFIEEKTNIRPNRVDYLFCYKKKDVEIYGATYRLDIEIQGDWVGSFRQYLNVPEQWEREFAQMRSFNQTTSITTYVFFIALMIAILVYFIIRVIHKDLNIRLMLLFGISAFIIQLLAKLNQFPLDIYFFSSSQSMGNFYTSWLIQAVLSALVNGVIVAILTGAAEHIYRSYYPKAISLDSLFSLKGMQTKSFFQSITIGILLAFIFMAFQTAFYLMAKNFGAWAPAEVEYSDILATKFPFFFIILAGFSPAVIEEFTFRLFAIPFLSKVSKSRIFAVIFSALVWGFLHSNYPNQPFWIRGAEVGLFGIFISVIFLKFNILTALVWHYTIDAFYSSLVLIKVGTKYQAFSAILAAGIVFIPLIISLFYYKKNKGFIDESNLLNENQEVAEKPRPIHSKENTIPNLAYNPLPSKHVKAGILIALIASLIFFLPAEKLGEFYQYPVKTSEAIQTANNFLVDQGIDPANYKTAVELTKNYSTIFGKYVLEKKDIKFLNNLLARKLKSAVCWTVRYYIPEEKDEYLIEINPMENSVVGFEHLLAEEAPGFDLDENRAKLQAEKFLSKQIGDLSLFELKENYASQKDNRLDHTFIYEAMQASGENIRDAKYRLKIEIKGDETATFKGYYKLPENWLKDYRQRTLLDSLRQVIQIGILLLAAIWIVRFYSHKNEFRPKIAWKLALIIGITVFGFNFIGQLLNVEAIKMNYDTSWQVGTFLLLNISMILIQSLIVGSSITGVVVLTSFIYPEISDAIRKQNRAAMTKDALVSTAIVIVGLLAVNYFYLIISASFPAAMVLPDIKIPALITSVIPIFKCISSILIKSVIAAALVAIFWYFLKKIFPKFWQQILSTAILIVLFLPNSVDTLSELLFTGSHSILLAVWIMISVKYFLRANYLAWLLTGTGYFMMNEVMLYISTGSAKGRLCAYYMIIGMAISIIWLLTEQKEIHLFEKNK